MLLPVRAIGMELVFYPIGANMEALVRPELNDIVVIVHYFGWLNPATEDLRQRLGWRLIEDATQAFLSDWKLPTAYEGTIISGTRKFAPTSLGGWVSGVEQDNIAPESRDLSILYHRAKEARRARGRYLEDVRSGLASSEETQFLGAFQDLEDYLDAHPLEVGLPTDALALIASVDWKIVAARRKENWQLVSRILPDTVDRLFTNLPGSVVPLGCPVLLPRDSRNHVRAALARRRIYCPVHWILPNEVDSESQQEAHNLASRALTLPIDQRYSAEEMELLVKELSLAIERHANRGS